MEYWEEINNKLKPWIDTDLNKTVVDLFAGCGGLSLGFEANGFKTIGYEIDSKASETYNNNLNGKCFPVELTQEFSYPKADIVIGGPPCQPFSGRGKQLGIMDARDGFPIFIDAIKKHEALELEYFEIADQRTLIPSTVWSNIESQIAFTAVNLNGVRLIDNMTIIN